MHAHLFLLSWGGMETDFLKSEGAGAFKRTDEDLKMTARAVRNKWPVSVATQRTTVARVVGIIRKTECTIMTKDGPVTVDGPADANALRAAGIIQGMTAENQTDYWSEDKNQRLDAGKATENVGRKITVTIVGAETEDTLNRLPEST